MFHQKTFSLWIELFKWNPKHFSIHTLAIYVTENVEITSQVDADQLIGPSYFDYMSHEIISTWYPISILFGESTSVEKGASRCITGPPFLCFILMVDMYLVLYLLHHLCWNNDIKNTQHCFWLHWLMETIGPVLSVGKFSALTHFEEHFIYGLKIGLEVLHVEALTGRQQIKELRHKHFISMLL